ncbi:hypothetical protein, partial [Undibacterium sp.]|uniref:hypothetical protein n=1 Tax=Undibacterium sp. TaxID=1914977 RepID=UPI00374DD3B8
RYAYVCYAFFILIGADMLSLLPRQSTFCNGVQTCSLVPLYLMWTIPVGLMAFGIAMSLYKAGEDLHLAVHLQRWLEPLSRLVMRRPDIK